MDRPGSAVYRFFSFVPMDIYPTAHYIWPSNPTYLTDQHNIVLTVLYGAVLVGSPGISPIPTTSDSWCCHPRSSCSPRSAAPPPPTGSSTCRGCRAAPALTSRIPNAGRWHWSCLISRIRSAGTPPPASRRGHVPGTDACPKAPRWFSRLVIILFFLCCPLAVFSTISLTKSPLFAFSFVWAFGVWYELFRTWRGKGDKVVRLRRRSFIALILACVVMLASAKYAWYIIVLQLILALLSDHRRWKAYVVALLLPVIVLHGAS